MSLAPSPPGSGRNSPLPRHRLQQRPDDEEPRRQDKSYKRYATSIEKALATFEGVRQEWADYISFLSRLLKAIQGHPPVFENIPHKSVVACRLSQCLIPSLPSGVHQKALETYATIFSLLQKEQLARDLHVWLPGLAPVLSFASLSIRPSFLALLEVYILSLSRGALRPALKSLILALLPGLEDETSEDFDRTLQIIDSLRDLFENEGVEKDSSEGTAVSGYFWQCVFLASISSASRRAGALAYLVKRLPKLGLAIHDGASQNLGMTATPSAQSEMQEFAEFVITPEPGLLIRSFAAGLTDEHMLVQRGYLDLLVTHLPLDSLVLTDRVDAADLERLVTAAVGVVVRRDMSLNRRLWSWFLGPQSQQIDEVGSSGANTSEHDAAEQMPETLEYLTNFGLNSLKASLMSLIQEDHLSASASARPFRICLSLMDRWDIGRLLVPYVFRQSMEKLMSYRLSHTHKEYHEVLRSATSFFDGIESGVVWKELLGILTFALTPSAVEEHERTKSLLVMNFIIDNFNIREEEMIEVHIPLVSILMLNFLSQGRSKLTPESRQLSNQVLEMAFAILEKLVLLIPPVSQVGGAEIDLRIGIKEYEQAIQNFYHMHEGNPALAPLPVDTHSLSGLLVAGSVDLVLQTLTPSLEYRLQGTSLRILALLLTKAPRIRFGGISDMLVLFQTLSSGPSALSTPITNLPFPTLSAMVQVLSQLSTSGSFVLDPLPPMLSNLLANLVETTWAYLTPSIPKYHIEAVHCLWQLHQLSGKHSIVEAILTASTAGRRIQGEAQADQVESARRFAVLWNHTVHSEDYTVRQRRGSWSRRESTPFAIAVTGNPEYQLLLHRPLFLLLDALATEHTELHHQVKSWIGSMPNLSFILDLLLSKLFHTSAALLNSDEKLDNTDRQRQSENDDMTAESLYFLEHILALMRLTSPNVWSSLADMRKPANTTVDDPKDDISFLVSITLACLRLVEASISIKGNRLHPTAIQHTALAILQCLLQGPSSAELRVLAVDEALIEMLRAKTAENACSSSTQIALLDTILPAVRLRMFGVSPSAGVEVYPKSPGPAMFGQAVTSLANDMSSDQAMPPPPNLIKCLQEGISASSSFHALDHWLHCLIEVLPFYAESLFQNLIPLVECFCEQIRSSFQELTATFADNAGMNNTSSEQTVTALLGGLEHVLASAHHQLTLEESQLASSKPVEQAQGFFGNVVSGVFSTDVQKTRSALANTRLTVLLCVHDVVRICVMIWSWASPRKTFGYQDHVGTTTQNYVSVRLRNKSRRILDRIYTAEALECLETLVNAWNQHSLLVEGQKTSPIIVLLNGLDGARPKNTMPAIFNAIYSRNSPAAIDASRTSTLTFDVTDLELSHFLVEYARSLEDDAMDEIWSDCMTFLRDVLANPLPHHAILPNLLVFLLTLAEKIERTNFGEQRRMRRELSEIANRLLQATFTTRTAGTSVESSPGTPVANVDSSKARSVQGRSIRKRVKNSEFAELLLRLLPNLQAILIEGDRFLGASTLISVQFISPFVHSKTFPDNIKSSYLNLLSGLAKAAPGSKAWKKDVSEAFGHNKFFSCRRKEVIDGWLVLVKQWISNDKDRLTDLVSRIVAPTGAGMLFGVGATTARLEADKKTQLTLRRISTIILAMEEDFVVGHLHTIEEKLVELLGATVASSPSFSTRSDVFIMLRAIVLKTSSIHLAPLWPLITAELRKALLSALPNSRDYDTYNALSLLQACKLLDSLLVLAPEDFQLQEWLFVTDTIDAVYRPSESDYLSLADDIAEDLGAVGGLYTVESVNQSSATYKVGLLKLDGQNAEASKEDIVTGILRPFFNQLSIHAYEGIYSMKSANLQDSKQEILMDLFDDTTIIG